MLFVNGIMPFFCWLFVFAQQVRSLSRDDGGGGWGWVVVVGGDGWGVWGVWDGCGFGCG